MWNQERNESSPASPVPDPIGDSEAFEFQHQESRPWSNVKARGIASIFKNRRNLTILVGAVLCFAVVLYLSSSSSQLLTTNKTAKRDSIPSDAYADETYVALCLSVGQQAKDLPEFFIHHYHHLGIRRFYIMDDATVPPLSETQDYGIPREAITFVYYTKEDRAKVQFMQPHLYDECHRLFGDRHVWMGFIDVDEFLEMRTKEENFYQFLQSYDNQKDVGAVGVQWFVHTASNIQTRQPSCRKAFTTCVAEGHDENKSIKSIVKMSFFVKPTSPHSFETIPGTRTVGEHGDTVPFANRYAQSHDRIALHHYTLKSREEYQEKMDRDNGMHDHGRTWDLWNKIENEYPHVECPTMAQYNP